MKKIHTTSAAGRPAFTKIRILAAGVVGSLAMAAPVHATYNASATGTVGIIQQMGPSLGFTAETVIFTLSSQPSSTPCGSAYFVISPNTVPDAAMRKNYLAMILQAKATGGTLQVGYDSGSGFCDQTYMGIYWLEMML
jgi:hypothetical protein